MESFFPLAEHFHTQADPAFCKCEPPSACIYPSASNPTTH